MFICTDSTLFSLLSELPKLSFANPVVGDCADRFNGKDDVKLNDLSFTACDVVNVCAEENIDGKCVGNDSGMLEVIQVASNVDCSPQCLYSILQAEGAQVIADDDTPECEGDASHVVDCAEGVTGDNNNDKELRCGLFLPAFNNGLGQLVLGVTEVKEWMYDFDSMGLDISFVDFDKVVTTIKFEGKALIRGG